MVNTLGEELGTLSTEAGTGFGADKYKLNLDEGVLSLTISERDLVPPMVSDIQISTTEPTNQPVVVTAQFSDNKDELASRLYRIGETGEWLEYLDGVTLFRNTDVYFKAIDEDEVSISLNNGSTPAVIRCSVPFLYVMMPLRIN